MHRILIVSDEEFLRDVIRLSLADMQADVRCASDVPDMQRLVRRMLFDLVVVVGTSAFFTGCDVVRTLRPAAPEPRTQRGRGQFAGQPDRLGKRLPRFHRKDVVEAG